MKYFIKTFGCAQNQADSERIASFYESRGYTRAKTRKQADDVIINTCMIRQSAENRVYGLVHNLTREKTLRQAQGKNSLKIIVTGCMVGMAVREKSGRMLSALARKMPGVDEFLPIEEVGFDFAPVRIDTQHAWVPVSNGCNNFCTFCVVPYTRGREISRPTEDILSECRELVKKGIGHITLVGQNVNSYGADLLVGAENIQVMRDIPGKNYFDSMSSRVKRSDPARETGLLRRQNGLAKTIRPTYVTHLGRMRIPTLFPQLLEDISSIPGIVSVDFISANPWDFSDELIEVMRKYPVISRDIHLPVQAGDNDVLRRMNRWYTREDYLELIAKIRANIADIRISTDIIVGFPGETEEQFEKTVDLARQVGFAKAYVAMYSDRPMTAAHKALSDDVPAAEKKRRWQVLEDLINKPNLKKGTYAKSIRYAQ